MPSSESSRTKLVTIRTMSGYAIFNILSSKSNETKRFGRPSLGPLTLVTEATLPPARCVVYLSDSAYLRTTIEIRTTLNRRVTASFNNIAQHNPQRNAQPTPLKNHPLFHHFLSYSLSYHYLQSSNRRPRPPETTTPTLRTGESSLQPTINQKLYLPHSHTGHGTETSAIHPDASRTKHPFPVLSWFSEWL
jgi:hypothetical protein